MSARTIFCRFCGAAAANRHGKDRRRRQRYKCAACGRICTNRTNTVRSGSRLSVAEWDLAARSFASRGGMSGADMARTLGYGRRTGQRLNRSFRRAIVRLAPRVLPGTSEWDESAVSTQWVLGGYARHTRQCLLRCIEDRTECTLTHAILPVIGPDGLAFTDEHGGYNGLDRRMTVCHSREFVNSQARFVHTNTIDGVWVRT